MFAVGLTMISDEPMPLALCVKPLLRLVSLPLASLILCLPVTCEAQESRELSFLALQSDLREKGVAEVVADLKSGAGKFDHRLADAVVAANAYPDENWKQLWFQLQARTLRAGWESVQASLLKQRPADSLVAVSAKLVQANPVVLRSWKLPGRLRFLTKSTDGKFVYAGVGFKQPQLVVIDTVSLKEIARHRISGVFEGLISFKARDLMLMLNGNPGGIERTAPGDGQYSLVDPASGRSLGMLERPSLKEMVADPASLYRSLRDKYGEFSSVTKSDSLTLIDQAADRVRFIKNRGFPFTCRFSTGERLGEPTRRFGNSSTLAITDDYSEFVFGWPRLEKTFNGHLKPIDGLLLGLNGETEQQIYHQRISGSPNSAAFLKDGESLLVGTSLGRLQQYKTRDLTGPQLPKGRSVEARAESSISDWPITHMARDERDRVFVGNRQEPLLRLVDPALMETQPITELPPAEFFLRRAVSPDGVWEADFADNTILVRDSSSRKLIHRIELPNELIAEIRRIRSVALNPVDGTVVVAGDKLIHWNLLTGRGQLVQPTPKAKALLVSPDGLYAVARNRKRLTIYNALSGTLIKLLDFETAYFRGTHSFLPEGLIAIEYDAYEGELSRKHDTNIIGVRVFELQTGKEVRNYQQGLGLPKNIAYARTAGTVTTMGSEEFKVWKLDQRDPLILKRPDNVDFLLGVTDDGKRLFAWHRKERSEQLVVIDGGTGQVVRRFDLEISTQARYQTSRRPICDGRTLVFWDSLLRPNVFEYFLNR